MSKSLNEIIYSIRETLRDYSDDSDIQNEHLRFQIDNLRAEHIRRIQKDPRNRITDDMSQDLGCVELETADRAECCDITIDCDILRTKQILPSPVRFSSGEGITRVGPIDKIASSFSFVNYRRAIYSGNGQFNGNSIFAFYLNGRIYLKVMPNNREGKMMEFVNIRGIFQDPKDVSRFTKCSGESCYSDDDPYPITNELIPVIENQVIQRELQKLSIPTDLENDAQDSRQSSNTPNNESS